jgi:hypothetical protein
MLHITFEHVHSLFPDVTEGPFEWIEMIYGNMFGLRPGEKEAEEIAGVNHDATWDAGPFEDAGGGLRKRRAYTRWTITEDATSAQAALERIRQALYRDGPDTAWNADTLDEVAVALRIAGLAPEGLITRQERQQCWALRIAALVARLQAIGDESLLDDLMHDLHGGETAAEINNRGYQGQVEAAFDLLGAEEAEATIGDILDQAEEGP